MEERGVREAVATRETGLERLAVRLGQPPREHTHLSDGAVQLVVALVVDAHRQAVEARLMRHHAARLAHAVHVQRRALSVEDGTVHVPAARRAARAAAATAAALATAALAAAALAPPLTATVCSTLAATLSTATLVAAPALAPAAVASAPIAASTVAATTLIAAS